MASDTTNKSYPNTMALFDKNIPSLEMLQCMVGDIDQHLSDNDKSIEKVLQELVKATNGLSADNNYTNIKDAMDSLIHTPVLEECACLPPDPEDVNKLLKAVLHHLTSSPGSEYAIFDQLLYLASHEGLGLPIRAPKPDLVGDSTFSLNSITDVNEKENDIVWEDIRSRLRRYFLECLKNLPRPTREESRAAQNKRIEYLQSLCILYPDLEVWASYQQLRSQEIAEVIREHLGMVVQAEAEQLQGNSKQSKSDMIAPRLNTPPKLCLGELAEHISTLVSSIQRMVKDDADLFLMGVFHGRVDFVQCIQDLYMETLTAELQPVIGDTVAMVMERDSMVANNKIKDEMGNNHHSRVSADGFMDTQFEQANIPLSSSDMSAFISIVSGLASLDTYMRHLFDQVTRDFAPPIVPHKPKSSIKGVLKNSSQRDSSDLDVKVSRGRDRFNRTGIMSEAIPPPFGVTPCMMPKSNKQTILDSPSKKLHWNWIELLEGLVPDVTRNICKLLQDTLHTSLQQEDEAFHKTRCVNEVPVCRDLVNGWLDYPKVICVSLAEQVSALENFMPLAIIASEGEMKAIRTAYTDAIESNFTQILEALSNRLMTFDSMTEDTESEVYTSILEVYKILSAAVFSTSYLTHIQSVLTDEDTRRSLHGIHKQLTELTNTIVDIVKGYHSGVISSSILHDAEGNNWLDQRAFFEDERISFTIQMWNLHLKGLQQELYSSCPPHYAQRILALVLRDSLSVLSQRYSRLMPTYKRTKQFRSDITTILMTTMDFLWSVANTVQALVDHQLTRQPYADIHNCCICLLSVMAVVCSPLQDLYKVYKKGFQYKRLVLKDAEKEGVPMVIPWMSWIRMEVFYGCEKGFDALQKRSAVYILLKLLANQPSPNFTLTLQALLVRDNLLPVLLVRNADTKLCQSSQESLSSTSPNVSGCGGICCPGQHCNSNQSCEIADVIQPIVDVLVVCTDHPNALANVLIAMIEKDDDMSIFEASCLPGKTVPVPPWMACVYELLSSYIDGAIRPSIVQLTAEPRTEASVGFLDSLRELPCGCRPKQTVRTPTKSDNQELQYKAMQSLLERLSTDLTTLPMPLLVFFATLQQNASSKGVHLTHNSPGIQIIASCLYNKLHDPEGLIGLVGHPIDVSTLTKLSTIGDHCQQIIMCEDASGLDSIAPEAAVFIKANSEWLTTHINNIVRHLNYKMFAECSAYPLEGSPYEFVEHYMSDLAGSVCSSPDGQKNLLQIYHILKNNMEWFEYHLEIPPALPLSQEDPATRIPQFTIAIPPPLHSSNLFSPLDHFNMIGDSPIDHDALAEFNIDWLKLLQSDMGMTETAFRNLLSHRHEMQEDAYLEEVEKKPVRVLKSKYDLDGDDLV